jgi:L-ascorbate metabolism protein UlaG (beta-lactamase superfamily)
MGTIQNQIDKMKTFKFKLIVLLWAALLPLSGLARPGADPAAKELLTKPLKQKEALVWYLHHSGWAIKTKNHLLIFDYWQSGRKGKPGTPSLDNGFINPSEIAGQKVTVFTSHRHGDHYDPVILEWAKTVKDITYIFGWKATDDPAHFHFMDRRQKLETGGLEIFNIYHQFDNIPESAFLVRVDGLTIYHAGDHCHSKAGKNPVFKDNIRYLSEQTGKLDLMFTPTFGGEIYAIKKLSPRFVFPMHDGGNERQYLKFANKAVKQGAKTSIITVAKPGDHVFYSKGRIKKISKLRKR